jgi:DNA invertase Pin-like site-specific DNA recombinase
MNEKMKAKAYGYIRVSTEKQDYDNQKFGILEYANKNNIADVEFVEETITSKKDLKERAIYKLIMETLNENDTLLVGEVTRLGRSTFEAMEILKTITERKIKTHIIKNNIKICVDDTSDLLIQMQIFMFGLAGQIERDFISLRTKESLDKRQREIKEKGYFISKRGIKRTNLGRQKGQQVKSSFDKYQNEIVSLLKKKVNIANIAKIINKSRTGLSHYIITRKLKERAVE